MAFKADLTVTRGLAPPPMLFTWSADGAPVNLAGCSAKLQAKVGGGGAALFTLTTAAGGGITLGGAAGTIALQFTAAQAALLGQEPTRYDMVLTYANGSQEVLMEGVISAKTAVTDIP
jgi:hypothetical protein